MICSQCPRECRAERSETSGKGYCGQGSLARVALAAPHFWEEPPVSGRKGAGTVFFTGCNLKCVYCQNANISQSDFGISVSSERLREIYFDLINKGVHNIELVTPGHFTDAVIDSLKGGLTVPVAYNSGGYESVETLKRLEGYVDIFMPDFKYSLSDVAGRLSNAPDYPEVCMKAIAEMYRQVGPCVFDDEGMLRRGVIVRHLVLPGELRNTFGVIDAFADKFGGRGVYFSLMSQYTPIEGMKGELARRLRPVEYKAALSHMEKKGITLGFTQELSSSGENYTPSFDLSGV